MLPLAKYERRPARKANISAWLAATAYTPAAFWVAFQATPPQGWWRDARFEADLSWITAYWGGTFTRLLDENENVLPGLRHASSAVKAAVETITSFGLAAPVATHLVTAAAAAFVASLTVHSVVLRSTPVVDTREHVDGLQLRRGRAAVKSAIAVLSSEVGKAGPGLSLSPGIAMSKLRELRGILLLGATGSGKTRLILYFLDAILEMIRLRPERGIRLLIHDTTGEILAGLPLEKRQFAVLHGHKKGGFAWAMGRDIRTTEDCEASAAVFAPDTKDGIWTEGSVTIIAGCLVLCQAQFGTQWGADEFYGALLTDPVELRAALEILYPPAAQLIEIDPETGGLSKTTISFFLSFRAAVLRQMRPLAKNWGVLPASSQFSFIDWLEERPGAPSVVVLQRSGKYPELSAAWIGAVVDTVAAHASGETFENSQTRRVFLCLDELASLKRLRRLPDLLDIGRNKGIGVIAALQEVEQLQEHYGASSAASILKRFRTKIVCQQNQDGATDQLSKTMIGTRTVLVEQTSQTKTVSKDGITTSATTSKQSTDVPILRGERLAYDLGVYGNKVKGLVVGLGDVVELEWPMTIWKRRRKG